MTEAVAGEDFSIAFLVFNTIANILTHDDQVRCDRSEFTADSRSHVSVYRLTGS